jgi:hypothetical protein
VNAHTSLDSHRAALCVHFLRTYATPPKALEFCMRHLLLQTAVELTLEQSLDDKLVLKHVIAPSVQMGHLPVLLSSIASVDASLEKVQSLVATIAAFLRSNSHFMLLHQTLEFARNFSGAAMVCIKMFELATDFPARLTHLQTARIHLQNALKRIKEAVGGADSVSHIGSEAMSEADVTRTLNSVELQLEITKWFMSQMPSKSPSLFGSQKIKCEIAEALLPHNFPLAQRVMVDFRLPHVQICSAVTNSLARGRQLSKLNDLLSNLKGKLTDKDWDHVVLGAIEVFARELGDDSNGDKLVKFLKAEHSKLTACVLCHKFKTAYQLAFKQQSLQDINYVKTEALAKLQEGKDDGTLAEVVKMCNRYISSQKTNP